MTHIIEELCQFFKRSLYALNVCMAFLHLSVGSS